MPFTEGHVIVPTLLGRVGLIWSAAVFTIGAAVFRYSRRRSPE